MDDLKHYASEYYDPEKAHEYYMKNRKLKGRTTGGLTDEGKQVWTATKGNIDDEKKSKVMEANLYKEQAIQESRSQAEQTRYRISTKYIPLIIFF